jgi:hypothetical protein
VLGRRSSTGQGIVAAGLRTCRIAQVRRPGPTGRIPANLFSAPLTPAAAGSCRRSARPSVREGPRSR